MKDKNRNKNKNRNRNRNKDKDKDKDKSKSKNKYLRKRFHMNIIPQKNKRLIIYKNIQPTLKDL